MDEPVRLNKYLSMQGVCSRREADELILNGQITIDGRRASLGDKVNGTEHICLRGKEISKTSPRPVYLALNKPKGIVCTTKNDRMNVIDFLNLDFRVFPIGRLDKDSEGLLLLTNDGSVVNALLRASYMHEKEYMVQVDHLITADFIHHMAAGVVLPELGVKTRPCQVKKQSARTFSIVLTQGLNRQIRRMCEACGYRVQALTRIRILQIYLKDLQPGQWRYLTQEEISQLEACRIQASGKDG